MKYLYLICIVLGLASYSVTTAQMSPCDSTLQASEDAMGYMIRQPGIRCEGLYETPTASDEPPLEIISVLMTPPKFDLTKDTLLEIIAPEIKMAGGDIIRIRATPVPIGIYYRMDGLVLSGQTFSWPVSDILASLPLNAESIGIYGWTGTEKNKTFIPLCIRRFGEKSLCDTVDNIYLAVRPNKQIDRIFIEWRNSDGTRGERLAVSKSVSAEKLVVIDFPEGPPGSVILDLHFLALGDWDLVRLKILRPR